MAGDEVRIAGGVYVDPDMAVEARFVVIDQDLTLAGGYSVADWEVGDLRPMRRCWMGRGWGRWCTPRRRGRR